MSNLKSTNSPLPYSLEVMAKEAVTSASKRFHREAKPGSETFREYYMSYGDEQVLVKYCIASFFLDRDNSGGYSIMIDAIRQVYDDLHRAIVRRVAA